MSTKNFVDDRNFLGSSARERKWVEIALDRIQFPAYIVRSFRGPRYVVKSANSSATIPAIYESLRSEFAYRLPKGLHSGFALNQIQAYLRVL